MKTVNLLAVALFLVRLTFAQNLDCRQTWMAPDAPAFCAWQAEPSLPEARTYHAVAMSSNYLYVLGGYRFDSSTMQITYYDSVMRSTINSDGHLTAWVPEPSFKNGRSGAAATTVGNCLFLSGGSSSTSTSVVYDDDVQYARIESDGRLSGWITSPNHFKVPRSNHSLMVVTTERGTFLNAVAGVTQIGQDTVHLDTIEVARVGPDCSVGEWTSANYHLKGGRSTPQALVVRNNIVVIGGWGDLDLIDVYDDVQIADERSDGSPNPWRFSSGRLTTGIYGHSTVLTELTESEQQPGQSLVLSIGGQPGTGSYSNWISYAYVLPGVSVPNAIGIWRIAPTGKLPSGRAGLGAVQSHARLYIIGGSGTGGQFYSDVLSASFDFGRP
jgi:hypothetical protein